jgi:hypothetical protein
MKSRINIGDLQVGMPLRFDFFFDSIATNRQVGSRRHALFWNIPGRIVQCGTT